MLIFCPFCHNLLTIIDWYTRPLPFDPDLLKRLDKEDAEFIDGDGDEDEDEDEDEDGPVTQSTSRQKRRSRRTNGRGRRPNEQGPFNEDGVIESNSDHEDDRLPNDTGYAPNGKRYTEQPPIQRDGKPAVKYVFTCRTCPYFYPIDEKIFFRDYHNQLRPDEPDSAAAEIISRPVGGWRNERESSERPVEMDRIRRRNKKQVDIIGGDDQFAGSAYCDNATPCERCGEFRAYFYQVQIRGADEPMTTFYRCVKCGREWRDG